MRGLLSLDPSYHLSFYPYIPLQKSRGHPPDCGLTYRSISHGNLKPCYPLHYSIPAIIILIWNRDIILSYMRLHAKR